MADDPYAGIASAPLGASENDPYAGIASAPVGGPAVTVDFSKPQQEVIKQINAAPEALREQIRRDYGTYVGRLNQQGGGTGQDVLNAARAAGNTALFGFGDEILAGIKTGGGFLGDYGTQLEVQRGYNRGAAEASPISTGIGTVAGAVAPMFVPGVGWVAAGARSAGAGMTAARGALVGAGQGALGGFGEAEGGVGNRLAGAATGGAIGGVAGGVLTGVANRLLPRAVPAVTAEVDTAAQRLGVELPYYIRSSDPEVRAAGTRFAQQPIPQAAGLREAGERGIQQIGTAAEQHVLGNTGATALEGALVPGGDAIRRTAEQRGVQIANEMTQARNALTSTVGADTPVPLDNLRQVLGEIVADRMAQHAPNPQAGLEDLFHLVRQAPQGLGFDAALGVRTGIGEQLGVRPLIQSDAARQPLLSRAYAALSRDVEQTADRIGQRPALDAYNATVRGLGDERRLLRSSFSENAQPEQLVRRLGQWTSTRGGAPQAGRAGALEGALAQTGNPNDARQIAQSIYADMLMRSGNAHAGGSPQRVATMLGQQTQEGQNLIAALAPDTADFMRQHQILGERLTEIMNNRNHSGTAVHLQAAGDQRRPGLDFGLGSMLGMLSSATGIGSPAMLGGVGTVGRMALAPINAYRQRVADAARAAFFLHGTPQPRFAGAGAIGQAVQGAGTASGRVAGQLFGGGR